MVTSVFVTKVIKIQQIMNTASLLSTASQQLVSVPLTQCMMVYKHRVAVAIRPQILDIVKKTQAITDSGVVTDGERQGDQSDTGDTTQCDCDGLSNDFPCWECVRTGRRDLLQ